VNPSFFAQQYLPLSLLLATLNFLRRIIHMDSSRDLINEVED